MLWHILVVLIYLHILCHEQRPNELIGAIGMSWGNDFLQNVGVTQLGFRVSEREALVGDERLPGAAGDDWQGEDAGSVTVCLGLAAKTHTLWCIRNTLT